MASTIEQIHELVNDGVLGSEQVPEPSYWRWPVLKPELLPEAFREVYEAFGEVRWYGDEYI